MSTVASVQIDKVSQVILRGQIRPTFSVRLTDTLCHIEYDVIVVGIFPSIAQFEVLDVLLVSYHRDLSTYSLVKLERKGPSFLLPRGALLDVDDITRAAYQVLIETR